MEIRDRIRELRRVKAKELVFNAKNWRVHPAAQAQALRALLVDVGYADALIARELPDGRLKLIDGHLRAETTPDAIVPVLVLDVNEAEADKLLLTIDPLGAMAEADTERLKSLIECVRPDDEAVRELLRHTAGDRLWETLYPDAIEEAEVLPDRADELRHKWRTESGQIWRCAPHRIICGDSTDYPGVTRLWNGESPLARLILTDPPYGVGYANKNRLLNKSDRGNRIQKPITNDHLSEAATGALFRDSLAIASKFCEPGACVYASVPGGPLLVRFISAFEAAGFAFKSTLVWVKNQFVIGMRDYHLRHELILYGWLQNGAHQWNGGRSQDSIFEVDKPRVSDFHPTTKPVELLARMIVNSSRPGEVIYDPFCGSGSTLLAAHQLGRIGYGVEIDPGYAAVTLERLSLLGLKPELEKIKMRKPRNSDGTLRRRNQPGRLTNRSLIARWVEAETLHLKRLGMGYQAIADHLMGVSQGQRKPMVAVPADVRFPGEYRISMQAVHRAFQRAIVRLPNAEAAELRKLDSERLEEMFLALQAGIRSGDAKAVDAGVRVLAHKARLNGYEAPRSIDLGGKDGGAIPIELARRVFEELDHEK